MHDFDDEYTGTAFDESEFDDPEADARMAEAAAVEALVAPPAPKPRDRPAPTPLSDEELDIVYMDDVDRRLDIASCYRELLDGGLFEQQDENSAIVENEVRHFVMQRLQVLMGTRKEGQQTVIAPKLPFNEGEIQTLRGVAAELVAGLGALRELCGLSSREIQALKTFAAITLKKGLVPSAAPPAVPTTVVEKQTPRPVLRRKPGSGSVTKPTAPTPEVVKPAPVPPEPPRPAPRASGRTAPGRRRLGRQRGEATAPAPAAAPSLTKKVVHDVDGKSHETTVQRIQRPAGAVPFPADDRSMEMASMQLASAQSVATARKAEGDLFNHR